MAPAKVTIVGAGLAGLAAAVRLAGRGMAVQVIEGAAHAGGRCRSYVDPTLGMTIDNGNHLVLSGNGSTFDYLRAIGAEDRLKGPDEAVFDFFDVRDGLAWRLRPNAGPIAWWVASPARRVPGTRVRDYLALTRLLDSPTGATIAERLDCKGLLWERLVEPLLLAALNTDPRVASAALGGAILRETLLRGGRAYAPRIASPHLETAFIAPALAYLADRGAEVRLGRRVQAIAVEAGRAARLSLPGETLAIGADEAVILAAPPWVASELLPGLTAPDAFEPIVNAHFRLTPPAGAPAMVGVIGGAAQWVFAFENRISVTVSAANTLVDMDRQAVAEHLWRDVARVHGLGPELPPWQIVKERRATFAATSEQDARRPPTRTALANLVLAGDWTDTGLPSTIEGAIRSGHRAADSIMRQWR